MALTSSGFAIELMVPLGLVGAARLLVQASETPSDASVVLAGAYIAVAALIKVSLGPPLLIIFLAALCLGRSPSFRTIACFGAGLGVTFTVTWVVMGGDLLAIPEWAGLGFSFISGYSAMAYELPGRLYFYVLAGVTMSVLLLLAIVKARVDGLRSVVAWVIVTLVTGEVIFRESFVRHDAHDVLFFAAVPLMLVAVMPAGERFTVHLQPSLLMAAAIFETVVVGAPPVSATRPQATMHNWLLTAQTLLSSSDRRAVEAAGRTSLQGIYRLPGAWLRETAGQRVTAVPRGQAIAWIYPSMRWAPLPTIQEYTAYTPSLDQLDATFLASRTAPPWVLQQAFGLDGRDPAWDSPMAEVALHCHYAVVSTASPFMILLHRTPADLCGKPTPVGAV